MRLCFPPLLCARFFVDPNLFLCAYALLQIVCISSIAELEELSGVKGITEIHRQDVDNITIPSKKNPGTVLRRIEEVFDCWFESGRCVCRCRSMPARLFLCF